VSAAYCWGIWREREHAPGRESDDTEILRLTGKHLEARGFQVVLRSPDEVIGTVRMNLAELRRNDHHKPCEQGCALGCVRMVSHSLGEPVRTLGASLRLALGSRGGPTKARRERA
jgi:hypothetical protein